MLYRARIDSVVLLGTQMNTVLQTLELNGNVIDYDGISALAEALTENTSLTTLHIRYHLQILPDV